MLVALCDFFEVVPEQLMQLVTPQKNGEPQVLKHCWSLVAQGRIQEAKILAASAWWDFLDESSSTADRLFDILMTTPIDNPEVLTIILATMFRQAAAGHLDEAFFENGFRIQRALAEVGELQSAQILSDAP